MTGSNRFVFDVVANDKASEATEKITSSVRNLVPALEAAASAYERMAASQKALGLRSVNEGQIVSMRQANEMRKEQVKAAKDAENAAKKQAEAEVKSAERVAKAGQLAAERSAGASERAAAKRKAAVEKAWAAEYKAQQQSEQIDNRRTATQLRMAALSEKTAHTRAAALQDEIARSKAIVQVEQERVRQAEKLAATLTRSTLPGQSLDHLGSGGAGKSSVAATQALVTAKRNLAAAEADVTRATSLYEQQALAAARADTVASRAGMLREDQLNTTRYALYQVGAAYLQASRFAGGAAIAVAAVAVQFEKSFAQVSRTTGLGQSIRQGSQEAIGQLQLLREELIGMTRDIPESFDNLTIIASLGAQLGIATSDIAKFTEVTAKFAATTNVTAEQSAAYFGRLQNILDVPTEKFVNLASAVAKLGVDSVATEDEILAVTTQIGAMANNAGFSAEYVVGLGTALASLRVPPELARGATTRIFQMITRAAADGGSQLDAYASVLGVTAAKAKQLWETSPEQFFSDLINGLGRANDAGQNLVPILDSLGIKASRDVPVITRLANGYQLLGQYVGTAYDSFGSGTFLDESFQTIAETTAASLTKLQNSLLALGDSIGSSFLPFIKAGADALAGFFNWVSKLPKAVTAPIVGIVAVTAALLAMRAASAILVGTMLAFRAASLSLGGGMLKTGGFITGLNLALGRNVETTAVATVSTGRHAAAVTGQGVVARTTAASLAALAFAAREQAVAAGAAAASTSAQAGAHVAAGSTAVAATPGVLGLGGAFRALSAAIGPVGWVVLGIGALVGILASVSSSEENAAKSAAALQQQQRELEQSFISVGGGAEGLSEAIKKDTEAYNNAVSAGQQVAGTFETINKTIAQSADGSTKLTTTIKDANGEIVDLSDKQLTAANNMSQFNDAVADATGGQPPLQDNLDATTKSLDSQTTALGVTTKAWQANALADNIAAAFNTDEARGRLVSFMSQYPGLIKAGLDGGSEAIKAQFGADMEVLRSQQAAYATELGNLVVATGARNNFGSQEQQQRRRDLEAMLGPLTDQLQVYDAIVGQIDTMTAATRSAATETGVLGALGAELNLDEVFEDGADAAEELEKQISEAKDQYAAFTDELFKNSDLDSGLIESFQNLGKSIAENGKEFNNFSEAGRANMEALKGTVDAFAETQRSALEEGTISAEEAAVNTQKFVEKLFKNLASQGVDTSQLDFLQTRIEEITGVPHTVVMNADVTGALNSLSVLNAAVIGIQATVTGVLNKAAAAANIKLPGSTASLSTPGTAAIGFGLTGSRIAAGVGKAAEEVKNLISAQKDAATASKKAADQAKEALEQQAKYIKDLAGFYEKLGSSAFGAIEAEGSAFEALQKLGEGLVKNGKQFNTVTEDGRKNFDALSNVFDSFGQNLSLQIEQGLITADQARGKLKEFAQGVYGELVGLGVSTENLTGFFSALGVKASGWVGNSADVQQYGGYIDAAAQAAAVMNDELDKAKEYADALGEALAKSFDRFYGLDDAKDSVQSAMNELRDAYQENIDKVKELRLENEKLTADLAESNADARKADIEQAISMKYGEVDRAADYAAQGQEARARSNGTQSQIDTNTREAQRLEEGRNNLEGYSEAAIDNRRALRDLQEDMLAQIEAYAATGKSTEEVAAYTEKLRQQFVDTGKQAGYTEDQLTPYIRAFSNYVQAIRAVPNTVTTTVNANTSGAINALNAIPKNGTYTTVAVADKANYDYVVWQLSLIPKRADYVVVPQVDQAALGGVHNAIVTTGNNALRTALSNISLAVQASADSLTNLFRTSGATGGGGGRAMSFTVARGGFITAGGPQRSFAKGGYAGLIPGRAPKDLRYDNMLAMGPGGKPWSVQSGEYVVRGAAVKKVGVPFMDAVNNGDITPRARGGSVGGGGGGYSSAPYMELSPTDRRLLMEIRDRNLTLRTNDRTIAASAARGNVVGARRGSN